ncbi:MAG: hypothetical protein LBG06_06920 [Deltaproteobacteria bacterium]|jgi:flagellin|nr:hypothetical protein [Deltaproteobacteria bacterium]
MALIMNHNLTALRTARHVGAAYRSLARSIERLSTGLRVNSAADDAAGLALRELMRADIAAGYQGVRNASDGVSLLQTAEGAMALIGEKLSRMRTLAMQAAGGLPTREEYEIINSEYQSMAAAIDGIAGSAAFNGVSLLDGSLNSLDKGKGLKIHFGLGDRPDADYLYLGAPDSRATASTGLMIGGDGRNDVWSTGHYGQTPGGCCGTGLLSLSQTAVNAAGSAFAYGYDWEDTGARDGAQLLTGRYVAGRYGFEAGMTYGELIDEVNRGTQSRIRIDITPGQNVDVAGGGYFAVCLGDDEAYYVGDGAALAAGALAGKKLISDASVGGGVDAMTAASLGAAINGAAGSGFWAMVEGGSIYVFSRRGGDSNGLVAGELSSDNAYSVIAAFADVRTGKTDAAAGQFSMGGEHWARMEATPQAGGGYAITLLGRDVGEGRNLHVAGDGDTAFEAAVAGGAGLLAGLKGSSFSEIQDASDGPWDGAEIRTKESAVRALGALERAMSRYGQIRAGLGALQARLESVMEAQTVYLENLQAAESRISDVDVAREMTELTRKSVLAQAATAMLAQANSLSNLALNLILG